MFNQIKAEYLKLRFSRLFKAIPLLFCAGLVLYMVFSISKGGTQIFVSEGDEETNTSLQGIIGFFAFTFNNAETPDIKEIIQSCMSCNVFLWIIILIFTIQFFTYDYLSGTIKLPVAYGISRIKLYLAKMVITTLYSAVCYFLFSVTTFCLTCFSTGFIPGRNDIRQYSGYIALSFLVMFSYILLCMLVCIFVKNTAVIATTMCIFTLGGAIIYTGIWQNFHSHIILKYLVWLDPLYYWMNLGTLRLDYGLVQEIAAYSAFGIFILLPVSLLFARNQEFR